MAKPRSERLSAIPEHTLRAWIDSHQKSIKAKQDHIKEMEKAMAPWINELQRRREAAE